MISFGNKLLFGAADDGYNKELWVSDGTDTGTVLLQDINPSSATYQSSSYPKNFFISGSTLYFSADDGTVKEELWKLEQSTLSTKNVSNKLVKVNAYPNPTNGILFLKIENQDIQEVKIYSLYGKEVMRVLLENKTSIKSVNLQKLARGMYILQVKTEINTFSKKVMRQ